MQYESSSDFISDLARGLRVPEDFLLENGFVSFLNQDISNFTDRDRTIINTIVTKHLTWSLLAKSLQQTGPGILWRRRPRFTALERVDIEQAMIFAGRELLSAKGISARAKGIIDEHCPCPRPSS